MALGDHPSGAFRRHVARRVQMFQSGFRLYSIAFELHRYARGTRAFRIDEINERVLD